MLENLLPGTLFAVRLIFARIGSAIMIMPGFGETYVAPRARLLLAIAISIVVTPVVSAGLPEAPASPIALFLLLGSEIGIGLFIGMAARVIVSALYVAGVVVAFQSSLSNAFVFDPNQAAQGSLSGTFLSIVGLLLIFVTGLHHLMLQAVVDSYALFQPGVVPPIGDFSDVMARLVAQSFVLALQISAPFVVIGMVFYLGLGLLARLMPQVQIFFVALPLQITLGFLILAVTLSASMLWFLESFENTFTHFLIPG